MILTHFCVRFQASLKLVYSLQPSASHTAQEQKCTMKPQEKGLFTGLAQSL